MSWLSPVLLDCSRVLVSADGLTVLPYGMYELCGAVLKVCFAQSGEDVRAVSALTNVTIPSQVPVPTCTETDGDICKGLIQPCLALCLVTDTINESRRREWDIVS
ncbi:hypothetical protein KIL84_008832 [Mauremys mutica]|uniref:Uncharacterized protein n=1 Tax=Mauremys mutica TaxID=74926 RepID=A0A9D4AZQ8_9SAUR|nr:hypothetical protein KIL84_008832 [Mauremys mutica]